MRPVVTLILNAVTVDRLCEVCGSVKAVTVSYLSVTCGTDSPTIESSTLISFRDVARYSSRVTPATYLINIFLALPLDGEDVLTAWTESGADDTR